MANIRMSRINSELQKAIAEIISNRLNNPDLDGLIISVVYVETAPDLSIARVGISVLSSKETQRLVVVSLNHAKNFIRRELMKMVRLKTMPELEFLEDDSYEKGKKLTDLIDSVIAGENNE